MPDLDLMKQEKQAARDSRGRFAREPVARPRADAGGNQRGIFCCRFAAEAAKLLCRLNERLYPALTRRSRRLSRNDALNAGRG